MPKSVRAEAVFNGEVVAASERAILVEGHHYFPKEDVRMELLEPCGARSLCLWKGAAEYLTLRVGDTVEPCAAWTYSHPSPLARRVKDRVAFSDTVRLQTTV